MSPAFRFKREGPQSLCVSFPTRNQAHPTERGVMLQELQDYSDTLRLSVDRQLHSITELVHCLALGGSPWARVHVIPTIESWSKWHLLNSSRAWFTHPYTGVLNPTEIFVLLSVQSTRFQGSASILPTCQELFAFGRQTSSLHSMGEVPKIWSERGNSLRFFHPLDYSKPRRSVFLQQLRLIFQSTISIACPCKSSF